MKRNPHKSWLIFCVLGLMGWNVSTGCPGSIKDRNRFFQDRIVQVEPPAGNDPRADSAPPQEPPPRPDVPGNDGPANDDPGTEPSNDKPPTERTPPSDDGGQLPPGCDPIQQLKTHCTKCHGELVTLKNLNFESKDLINYLKAKESTQCAPRKLISGDPLKGVLWEKLSQPKNKQTCGKDTMPPGGTNLDKKSLDCFKAWLQLRFK